MKYPTDRDGKSKTSSGADQEHYPEQNEVENPDDGDPNDAARNQRPVERERDKDREGSRRRS